MHTAATLGVAAGDGEPGHRNGHARVDFEHPASATAADCHACRRARDRCGAGRVGQQKLSARQSDRLRRLEIGRGEDDRVASRLGIDKVDRLAKAELTESGAGAVGRGVDNERRALALKGADVDAAAANLTPLISRRDARAAGAGAEAGLPGRSGMVWVGPP